MVRSLFCPHQLFSASFQRKVTRRWPSVLKSAQSGKKKDRSSWALRKAGSLGGAQVFAVCLRCRPCQVYSCLHPGISARDLSSARTMATPGPLSYIKWNTLPGVCTTTDTKQSKTNQNAEEKKKNDENSSNSNNDNVNNNNNNTQKKPKRPHPHLQKTFFFSRIALNSSDTDFTQTTLPVSESPSRRWLPREREQQGRGQTAK